MQRANVISVWLRDIETLLGGRVPVGVAEQLFAAPAAAASGGAATGPAGGAAIPLHTLAVVVRSVTLQLNEDMKLTLADMCMSEEAVLRDRVMVESEMQRFLVEAEACARAFVQNGVAVGAPQPLVPPAYGGKFRLMLKVKVGSLVQEFRLGPDSRIGVCVALDVASLAPPAAASSASASAASSPAPAAAATAPLELISLDGTPLITLTAPIDRAISLTDGTTLFCSSALRGGRSWWRRAPDAPAWDPLNPACVTLGARSLERSPSPPPYHASFATVAAANAAANAAAAAAAAAATTSPVASSGTSGYKEFPRGAPASSGALPYKDFAVAGAAPAPSAPPAFEALRVGSPSLSPSPSLSLRDSSAPTLMGMSGAATPSAPPAAASPSASADGPRKYRTLDEVSAAAKSASAAAAVLASPREEVKTRVLRWQRAVGSYGADDGRLNSPHGLAVDSEGNLFVADSTNSRVQVWDAGLAFKRSFACTQPRGVCLDAQGRVLVTTSEEHKVFVFEAGSRMPTATIGREGMRDGELSHPMGVTVLRDGRIAVADSGNDRIVFFTPQGRFHSRIRSQGDVSLNAPQFVAEMSSGSLVVCDESDRVQIFDAGGRFLRVLAKSGDSDGQVLRPRGVVVTPAGEIIVADEGNHCVNMWAPNMRFLSRFGSWGSGEGCFKGPWGVALLRDTLFVADSSNHRIVEARLEAR